MMTPLVFVALRAAAHHDDIRAPQRTTNAREQSAARDATLRTARHRPDIVRARRRAWLSRRSVPQPELP